MNITRAQLFGVLKSLPLIRFALMLGGGGVATIGVATVLVWLQGLGKFPASEAIWLARINGVVAIGLALTAIMGLVMLTLSFGRAGKVSVTGPGGVAAEFDFDTPDDASGEERTR